MSVRWRPKKHRGSAHEILEKYHQKSGLCVTAAVKIHPIAEHQDKAATCMYLRAHPKHGLRIIPVPSMGCAWDHHALVALDRHYVDALTGADGTPEEDYLKQHFQHPESVVVRPITVAELREKHYVDDEDS